MNERKKPEGYKKRCAECHYGKYEQLYSIGYYCDYASMTGSLRGCKAQDCDKYKPIDSKKLKDRQKLR